MRHAVARSIGIGLSLGIGIGLVLSLGLAVPAAAQVIELAASDASRCLSAVDGEFSEPAYPFDAWKREQTGQVLVELAFAAPDMAPVVTIVQSEGGSEFVDAVRAHVAKLRVPCLNLADGAPATLRQEYLFQPDQRKVHWSAPTDALADRQRQQLSCLVHQSGEKAPPFPARARQAGVQGRVVAQMRFNSPDQPPQAKVHSRNSARLLSREIAGWVQGYRMPCFEGRGPVEVNITFAYLYEGDAAYGLKSLTLLSLLPHVKGVAAQTLQFNTTQMGCPFDLQFNYRQPHMHNLIGEVGERRPERRSLMAWLAAQELNLAPRSLDATYGDTTTVTVPCVKLDIRPPEKK